jgi:hypothetical protein
MAGVLFPEQAGVASRQQLIAGGLSSGTIRRRVVDGRWRPLQRGVYVTYSGPPTPIALVWAAVLRAGPGAAAGPRTSLWLAGATDEPPSRLDVTVPGRRRARGRLPFDVEERADLEQLVLPGARPPRLRLEVAVLDVIEGWSSPGPVVDLVIAVIQRRLTSAPRLALHLGRRRVHRWRALVTEVLADVEDGVRSPLERTWVHRVERPHGLPRGVLNRADPGGGATVYRDVEYLDYGLVVELDGQRAHPGERAFRDRRRDNRVTVSGRRTLRYGWHEITRDPCGVAGEVAAVLASLGWGGQVRACGPGCGLKP